jgi:hypothetical protein
MECWFQRRGGLGLKVGEVLEENEVDFRQYNEVVLEECGDGFGSRLHWESGAKEGFRKLGLSDFKKLLYTHIMSIYLLCFYYV